MQEDFYLHLWRRRYYKCDYREINKPLDNIILVFLLFASKDIKYFSHVYITIKVLTK